MNTVTVLALVSGLTLSGPLDAPMELASVVAIHPAASPCCEAELSEALQLRNSGQMTRAHRVYHAVARSQAAAGEFPGESLWQAAEISHALGKTKRAARELDRVAGYARDFGRPNLEIRALFEAAHFYHLDRQTGLTLQRLQRVERLLQSPEVSEETRALVARRLTRESLHL